MRYWHREPVGMDTRFREYSAGRAASPKLWGDARLLAFAPAAPERSSAPTGRVRRAGPTACRLKPERAHERTGPCGAFRPPGGNSETGPG